MTISASSLSDCTHTLYQILVSLQIFALGGASTAFGYNTIKNGYGSYGNTPSFQDASVIPIQEYVWYLE
jgi:hypothetical protein